jgi:hypothetical protein
MEEKRKKIKKSLNYPLSILNGEIPDQEEMDLICKYGALDLVLIEGASDLIGDVIKNNLELILEKIVLASNNKNVEYMRSETFPFYVNQDVKHKYFLKDETVKNSDEYFQLVSEYREEFLSKKQKDIVTVLALNLGNEGHYAAVYYSNDTVYLFESMSVKIHPTHRYKYDSSYKSAGYYTPYYVSLAKDIFSPRKITVPDCISEELSLQFTGGFPSHMPLKVRTSNKTKEEQRLLSIQSTESQNHFCYLWAIWWLHLRLVDMNFETNIKIFNKLDPLVAIKRYAWCILVSLNLLAEIENKDFFKKHFMSIWSNVPLTDKLSLQFGRYDIPLPKCSNILDAITQSVIVVPLNRVENTPVPSDLCI